MSETWLTPDEVGELTGLKPNSWKAQCRKLAAMGIKFRPNGAGRPLVERAAVLAGTTRRTAAKPQPNWSALRGKAA
ncbi:DUF4224 domain-containing protein [Lysobacter sp. Hz 25]|uniref:DUF4224 domain-containing protein n=1 Tax=Lysobacter sp. Hz 25 TaxID=3383698 RepID=UPI0038D40C53